MHHHRQGYDMYRQLYQECHVCTPDILVWC